MAEEARPSQEQLSAYLDGELSSGEVAEVERRLQTDSRARRELAELTAVSRLLARSVAPAPPRDYRSVVPRPRPWWRLLEWAPALVATAAVALIALGAVGAVRDRAREAPRPSAQATPTRSSLVEAVATADAPGRERAAVTEAEAPASATVAATAEREVAAEAVTEASTVRAVTAEREVAAEAVTEASTVRAVTAEREAMAETVSDATTPARSAAAAGGTDFENARTIERAPPPSLPADEVGTGAEAAREAVVAVPSVAATPQRAGAPLEPTDARTLAPPTATRAAGAGVSFWPFALGGGLALLLSSIVWVVWRRRKHALPAA